MCIYTAGALRMGVFKEPVPLGFEAVALFFNTLIQPVYYPCAVASLE
jgi:hypothetical protein